MLWCDCSEAITLPPASDEIIRRIEKMDNAGDFVPSAGVLPLLSSSAMREMRRHLYADPAKESMGFLLGRACYASMWQTVLVEIEIAVPVQRVSSSRAHVSMMEESWPEVWKKVDQYPDRELIGWFHSHPGHGVFLSAEDKKTQRLWFQLPWQIALVMDPVRDEYGVFAGAGGSPVKTLVL